MRISPLRRRAALAALVGGIAGGIAPAVSAAAAPKRVPSSGIATVVSVDGPARLTLKTSAGLVKMRLGLLDSPEPGECGAGEATRALRSLTAGRRARVRYVQWGRRPDAEGRRAAIIGPRRADLTERSLGKSLIDREWARTGGIVTISEPDGITLRIGSEEWRPRPPRGVWARCGGRMHLPASEPPPPHAPAAWQVNPNGITEAIGPITLPITLAPGAALTVADVERIAPVESTDLGEGTCWSRVASLELILWASAAPGTPCRDGDVYAITTSGPGSPTTLNGLAAGQPASRAPTLFPRLAAAGPDALTREALPLAGTERVPWAWQTLVGVRDDTITSFLTSTAPWPV